MRSASLVLLCALACPVLGQEAPVPLFSPEEALVLSRKPISRMVDGSTCERIEGVHYRSDDGRLRPRPYASASLFRKGSRREPFMRVMAREDGVFVVRFPASPGDVIYARAYRIDSESGQVHFGNATKSVCVAYKVDVGTPLPIKDAVEMGSETRLD